MKDLAIRMAENFGFVLAMMAVIAFGVVRGLYFYTVDIRFFDIILQFGLIDAFAAAITFTGFLAISSIMYFYRLSGTELEKRNDGKRVLAVVPAFREGKNLARTVNSLLSSNYESLRVMIVCEQGDDRTLSLARNLERKEKEVEVFVNDVYPGSKPGAVNAVVENSHETVIGIFDADSVVDPDFIPAAVHRLERLDVVQARLIPEPGGVIESVSYYGNIIFSKIPQQILLALPGFQMALSNGTMMRRTAFEAVGGYDDLMTDDYDFTFKCYRNGLKVELISQHPVIREPAHSLQDWWKQRKRWMLSYMQVLEKLVFQVPNFKSYRDIVALVIALSSVLGSVLVLALTSKILLLTLLGFGTVSLLPLAMIIGLCVVARLYDVKNHSLSFPGKSVFVFPVFFPLMGVVSIKALISFFVSWEGGFYHTERA